MMVYSNAPYNLLLLLASLFFIGCQTDHPPKAPSSNPMPQAPNITTASFGQSPEGEATLFTLTNSQGNTVKLTNYGGIITSISIDGAEMVIGYDSLAPYLGQQPYYGALIGRYGNRIADGQFTLEGETFTLPTNNNGNQLHGGPQGFDKHLWTAETSTTPDAATVTLAHVSPDGDQGFPGELRVQCQYTWTNDNALRLTYTAATTKPTIVNLTNHTYFNISSSATVKDQLLTLNADHYTPVNDRLIPFGELAEVAGTPFDFRKAKPIGQDIKADHPQLALANGYDHNWALNDYDGNLREFALLKDATSGRQLRCFTTEPGVQIFTANFPSGKFTDRGGKALPTYGAICLETQHFPDSPNQPAFKTPMLKVGEEYRTETVYRFE
ncbi:MAG: aldose epimerase family protein [Bacteroidota bacterium]